MPLKKITLHNKRYIPNKRTRAAALSKNAHKSHTRHASTQSLTIKNPRAAVIPIPVEGRAKANPRHPSTPYLNVNPKPPCGCHPELRRRTRAKANPCHASTPYLNVNPKPPCGCHPELRRRTRAKANPRHASTPSSTSTPSRRAAVILNSVEGRAQRPISTIPLHLIT
jgi:hypothetical protein